MIQKWMEGSYPWDIEPEIKSSVSLNANLRDTEGVAEGEPKRLYREATTN